MRNLFSIFLFCVATVFSQNSTPKNYNQSNGLSSSDVTDITQDRVGYIWIATNDNGLVRFDGSLFSMFTEKDGLISNAINALLYDQDTLYVATDKGLSVKTSFNNFIQIPGIEITRIKKLRKELVLTTDQGIYALIDKKLTPIRLNDQIDLNPVLDIVYFDTGYYIAGQKALWYVDALKAPKKVVRIQDGAYTSLKIMNNKMYATTWLQGVQIFESNRNKFRFQNVQHITSINLLANEYWISTDNNGVYIYDTNFDFKKRISKYNGLKVNNIRKVFVDRSDNCWLATFGNGLYSYTSEDKSNAIKTPNVYFESIDVDYQVIDSILINNYTKTLNLRPDQNNISFSFKSIDINAPSKVEYRWKLNENNRPWTTTNTIDFPNLDSGAYTFEVQSRNAQQIESEPIRFSFFIDTPVYKKKWFIYTTTGTIGFILLLLVFLIIRNIKRKNLKKVQQLQLENHLLSLEQKALQLQMNPHFIFNVLNSIKALGGQDKMIEMNEAINNFALLLRGILHNSRKEEVSLKQEIETLKRYVTLEQQISSKSFEFLVNTDRISLDLDEILIPSMLIQPFIENAIKHGIKANEDKGIIQLRFEIKDVFLTCTITDNGIGFKHSKKDIPNTNHESVALKVTEERIQNISGNQSFYISEIKKKDQILGTKVWFKIPLKTEF